MPTLPDIGAMLPRDLPADRVLDFARRAERAGFAELWVVEDLGFRGGIAQTAAVLAATERITVGVGILPVAARNVAFAAMEIATLAELFPGRVQVGLGHGMPDWMHQVGVRPASILTYFDEYLTALRGLLAGEEVTVHGRYVRLDAVRIAAPAVVPPLLAGVRGPRSLALAGRVADGTVLAEPVTPEYLRAARAAIGPAGGGTPTSGTVPGSTGGMAEVPEVPAGHRVVAYNIGAVDDDGSTARELARTGLGWIGDPDWEAHIDPLPFAAEFRDLRARTADREDFATALPDAWVEQLAVAGTPDRARERLVRLGAAGADAVVLVPVGPDPVAALDRLARVLRPAGPAARRSPPTGVVEKPLGMGPERT